MLPKGRIPTHPGRATPRDAKELAELLRESTLLGREKARIGVCDPGLSSDAELLLAFADPDITPNLSGSTARVDEFGALEPLHCTVDIFDIEVDQGHIRIDRVPVDGAVAHAVLASESTAAVVSFEPLLEVFRCDADHDGVAAHVPTFPSLF